MPDISNYKPREVIPKSPPSEPTVLSKLVQEFSNHPSIRISSDKKIIEILYKLFLKSQQEWVLIWTENELKEYEALRVHMLTAYQYNGVSGPLLHAELNRMCFGFNITKSLEE